MESWGLDLGKDGFPCVVVDALQLGRGRGNGLTSVACLAALGTILI